jgi:hypothetical protein
MKGTNIFCPCIMDAWITEFYPYGDYKYYHKIHHMDHNFAIVEIWNK